MKRILVAAAAALLLFALPACSSGGNVKADVGQVADSLYNGIKFQDTLSPIDDAAVQYTYGITKDDYSACKVYLSTTATAEEIACFETPDAAKAKTLLAAVKKRLQNQEEDYSDYGPKEVPKIKDPVLITRGNYIFLCVSNDNSTATRIINDSLKTPAK